MPKDIEKSPACSCATPFGRGGPARKPVDAIAQGVHYIPNGDKARLLEEYLKKHEGEQALVFSRTKHGADKLAKVLEGWGFSVGARTATAARTSANRILAEFRDGTLSVLVATDVAARGIDIPTVRHVYNYDMPNVRKTTSTASAVLPGQEPAGRRSASARRPRWASCRLLKSY